MAVGDEDGRRAMEGHVTCNPDERGRFAGRSRDSVALHWGRGDRSVPSRPEGSFECVGNHVLGLGSVARREQREAVRPRPVNSEGGIEVDTIPIGTTHSETEFEVSPLAGIDLRHTVQESSRARPAGAGQSATAREIRVSGARSCAE